jgi:hypothetical protein
MVIYKFFIIAALTFISNIVGTVAGFGMSTIMLPILLNILSAYEAMLLTTILHWFHDLWKLFFFRKGINYFLLFFFGISSMLATILGAIVVLNISGEIFHRLLGLFLALYVLIILVYPSFKVTPSKQNAVLGGLLSGFSAGFFGIRGALKGAFLTAYNLPKEIYLATIGAIALIVDSSRLTTYLIGGMFLPKYLTIGLLVYVPLSFLGAQCASLIVDRIPQSKFRLFVAIFLGLMGLKLMLGL